MTLPTPSSSGSPSEAPMFEPEASDRDRRRLVAESLRVGNPVSSEPEIHSLGERQGAVELEVELIRPYEFNPRQRRNGLFESIKASIAVGGLRNPITVTRRPGERHYIVEAGGNTRLVAVQELWTETGDARFRTIPALYRPWRSECHVLSAHLIENEHRGDLTFWDKACALRALSDRLAAESPTPPSLRQLHDAIVAFGVVVNLASLSHCLFAARRLSALGPLAQAMGYPEVKLLQPGLNALVKRAEDDGWERDRLYTEVFEPVFQSFAQSGEVVLDPIALLGQCEAALARRPALNDPRSAERDASDLKAASADPPDPPAATAVPSVRNRHIHQRVLQFARAAGITLDLRADDAAPLGVRIGVGGAVVSDRRIGQALSLLRSLSAANGEAAALDPVTVDRRFLQWMMDPKDPAARALWSTLVAIRQSFPSAGAGEQAKGGA